MTGAVVRQGAPLHKGLAVLAFADAAEWERWLADHHADATGVWLKFAKKGAAEPSVGKGAAIEIAICYGWIDGQIDRWDDHAWLTRFAPRGPRSRWSRLNRETAARLVREGRMQPAGLRELECAETDGRMASAYPSQKSAQLPPDFAEALAANPRAKAFFESLSSANRYAFVYRIHHIKTPAVRAARVAMYVEMLSRGEVFHSRPKQPDQAT